MMIPFFILELTDPNDRQMMHELYEELDKKMYVIALGYTRNTKDAEDVVQNTWLSLCSAGSLKILQKFSSKKSLEKQKYIARCVRNKSMDLLQKRNEIRSYEVPLVNEELIRTGTADDCMDSHLVLQEEVKECMDGIQHLPPKQREYLSMLYIGNLTYKEIAHTLGKTEDSVRSQISEARKNLKLRLLEMRAARHGEQ